MYIYIYLQKSLVKRFPTVSTNTGLSKKQSSPQHNNDRSSCPKSSTTYHHTEKPAPSALWLSQASTHPCEAKRRVHMALLFL